MQVPFYGGSQAYAQPPVSPVATHEARATSLPHGQGNFVQVAGLGQLPPVALSFIALAGASFGGASVGYVASGDKEGALRGAAMSAGLAGVSDAINHWRLGGQDNRALAGLFGALGLTALSFSVWRMRRKKRWR